MTMIKRIKLIRHLKRINRTLIVLMCLFALILPPADAFAAPKDEKAETAAKTVRAGDDADDENDRDAKDDDKNSDSKNSGAKEENGRTGDPENGGTDGESDAGDDRRYDITEMTVVNVGTYEEWCTFAKNCALDSWSEDKYVVLTDNIDFNMKEFVPIPLFSGVFEGNGHTVNRAAFTEEQDYIGVFSKTTKNAVIRNLNVIGVMRPSGKPFDIGGIVGDNAGMIAACSYDGYVEGFDYIGGIAGYNEQSGIISGCSVTGKITGLHYVGGIAGGSAGLITGCTSDADINTVTKDVQTGINDIKVEEVFTSLINIGRDEGNKKSISATTSPVDVGGITGNNTGEISSCISVSAVGYEHVGYNVGGISGRTSGYIHDCANDGIVHGRKDVGGIAGQAEPYIRLDLDADIIAQLSDCIGKLHDSVEATIRDTDSSAGVVSARLNVIKSFADRALVDTGYLANGTEDFINSVSASANEIGNRIEYVLDETSKKDGPMDDMTKAGSNLKDAAKDLEEVAEDLDIYNYLDDGEKARYDAAKKAIEDATEEFEGYYDEIIASDAAKDYERDARDAYIHAKYIAGEWEHDNYDELTKEQQEEADSIAREETESWAAQKARDKYNTEHAPETYEKVLKDNAETIADIVFAHADEMSDDASGDAKDAAKNVRKMAGNLKDAGSDMKYIIREVADKGSVQFPQLSDEYRMHTNSLVGNIQGMSDNMGFLNNEMKGSTDKVCADLEGVNDQFSTLMLLFTDAMDGALEMDYTEIYEDESNDVCFDSVDATIADCRNNEAVSGDINTGGIAGTMAEEYDFDLESDVTGVKDAARKSTYRTKCVLRNDVNHAPVNGKKSYVGGVCGLGEIGTILKCSNFSKVSSETSDYVGGIAGRSYATIRNSYEKGILKGNSYVGGIAGHGTDIMECLSMPTIKDAKSFAGAVAGSVDESGKLKDNVFVSDILAGVDRISMKGKAEPVPYYTLAEIEGVPSEFFELNVFFLIDDEVVAAVKKRAGETVSPDEAPVETVLKTSGDKTDEITDEEGRVILDDDTYIRWDIDSDITVNADTEIEGSIVRYTGTLSSEQERANKQSVFLVDGKFREGDAIHVTAAPGNSSVSEEYVIEIPDDGEKTHLIRYQKADENEDVTVMVSSDGGRYEEVLCGSFGKYMTFTADSDRIAVRVDKKEKDHRPYIYAAIAALAASVLIILAVVFIIRSKRRRSRSGNVKNDGDTVNVKNDGGNGNVKNDGGNGNVKKDDDTGKAKKED